MAFITCITAPPKSLDDYDLQRTISMLLFTWSQLLQISSSGSNFLLLCIFIVFNLYIPYGIYMTPCLFWWWWFVCASSPLEVVTTVSFWAHTQTDPREPISGQLINSHWLLLKSCSCGCLISIPPTWQSWYPTCSNINLATLSNKPTDSGGDHLTQLLMAFFGYLEWTYSLFPWGSTERYSIGTIYLTSCSSLQV